MWGKALQGDSSQIREAKTNARAAQMFAEMLGIVCRSEYYKQGDQNVSSHIYPSAATDTFPYFILMTVILIHIHIGLHCSCFRLPCIYILGTFPLSLSSNNSFHRNQSIISPYAD